MSKILIFDVNETLLDLSPLKPHFKRIFDDADVMKQWFLTLLHSSLTVTLADDYKDFGALAGAALDVVSEQEKFRSRAKPAKQFWRRSKNSRRMRKFPRAWKDCDLTGSVFSR